MTIQIITPGRLPEEKRYTVTCRHCKCVFNFAAKDARRSSTDPRDGTYLMTVRCPQPGCDHEVHTADGGYYGPG